MKHALLLILTLSSLTLFSQAQQGQPTTTRKVSGIVRDSTGPVIANATVTLISGHDSTSAITAADGAFSFADVSASQFQLLVASVGYQSVLKRFKTGTDNKEAKLGAILIAPMANELQGVIVTSVTPIKVKEDTTEYSVEAYKVRDGAPIEDVIRKLPGVDVDKDGNITAQGKSVTKVRLNGKDVMGGDLKSITQNLPASIAQNMQIIDDYGDQANITGIKSGDPEKILNINIRPDKNYGYFGQGTVGAGADAQHGVLDADEKGRYQASANVFDFQGDRQIFGLSSFNNTNTSLFNFGGGGPRGGGPGGFGGGGGGGTASGSNGITTTRSIGLNYRDSWSKRLTVYGSYSFSDNTVRTLSTTIQSNTSLTQPSVTKTTSNETDELINHRFNFNIEYKIDSINYLKVVPTITWSGINTMVAQTTNFTRNGALVNDYSLLSGLSSHAPNLGINALYNHRFSSRGRNFSISVSAGRTEQDQLQNPVYTYNAGIPNAPLNQLISTNVRLDSAGINLSYIEPLSQRSFLELSYGYHYTKTSSDKETDTLAGTKRNNYALLSNDYYSTFVTNRVGLNYRFIEKKYNYTLGVGLQPADLSGYSLTTATSTHISTLNFTPTARFVYNPARGQNLTFNYSGYSTQPTYTELQPVIDFSNATYPVQGNTALKPEYNNSFVARYNKFDMQSGRSLFFNLSFTQTDDKVVSNTVTYPVSYPANPRLAGTILTTYQNASGFYSGNGSYSFNIPWKQRKYTLMFNGSANYINNMSFISNIDSATYKEVTAENIAKSWVLTQGARFRVDIQDVVNAELNSSYSLTQTDNSLPQNNVNNRFSTINLGVSGKNYFFKDWTLSYDYTKVIYNGYTGATNPNLLNVYVERRFLKNNAATIRLAAYDLFNQNTGFSTTQTGSYITQTQSNRLGRYFMLSFTLRLQKFAGKQPQRGGPDGPGGPGGRDFGPGRGGFGGPPPGGGPTE